MMAAAAALVTSSVSTMVANTSPSKVPASPQPPNASTIRSAILLASPDSVAARPSPRAAAIRRTTSRFTALRASPRVSTWPMTRRKEPTSDASNSVTTPVVAVTTIPAITSPTQTARLLLTGGVLSRGETSKKSLRSYHRERKSRSAKISRVSPTRTGT